MIRAIRPEWIFDGSPIADPQGEAEKAVDFLTRLRHPKAGDKSFYLPHFWRRIVERIYGPHDADGRRQTKIVFVLMPRGGRKTTIGAGLALLHTFGVQRRAGSLAIAAAASEDQASLAYDEASSIVKATPWLASRARPKDSLFEMHYDAEGCEFRALPADGDVQLGKTPNFVLADELIAWKDRRLWRALRTGLVKTPGSLMVIISQAGRGQNSLAFEMYDYARQVQSGAIDDPGFLPVIFETMPDADWHDEKLWHFVNPGLAEGFPDLPGLRQLAREALHRPAERDDFRQFNLNVWLEYSASPFVDMPTYDQGKTPVDLDRMENRPCYLFADLGLTTDLSAVVAGWPDDDDGLDLWAWFFCPADNLELRSQRDKVSYQRWADDRYITPTPGNVTDHRTIELHIRALCNRFDVQAIGFDPAYAQAVMAPLNEDGLPVVKVLQNWQTLAPAIKELERLIVGGKLRHGGHPVLRWNFENVAVSTDRGGNKLFHKGKSRDRIDGAVAAAGVVSLTSGRRVIKSFWEQPAAGPKSIELTAA